MQKTLVRSITESHRQQCEQWGCECAEWPPSSLDAAKDHLFLYKLQLMLSWRAVEAPSIHQRTSPKTAGYNIQNANIQEKYFIEWSNYALTLILDIVICLIDCNYFFSLGNITRLFFFFLIRWLFIYSDVCTVRKDPNQEKQVIGIVIRW